MYQNLICRRVARAEDEAELASVGQQIGGSGSDWDEEVLSAEEEGLVFFDGNSHTHCSAIPIMLQSGPLHNSAADVVISCGPLLLQYVCNVQLLQCLSK